MTPTHTTRRRRVRGTLAALVVLLALASPMPAAAAAWASHSPPAGCSSC